MGSVVARHTSHVTRHTSPVTRHTRDTSFSSSSFTPSTALSSSCRLPLASAADISRAAAACSLCIKRVTATRLEMRSSPLYRQALALSLSHSASLLVTLSRSATSVIGLHTTSPAGMLHTCVHYRIQPLTLEPQTPNEQQNAICPFSMLGLSDSEAG